MKLKDKFDEGLFKEFRGIKTSTMKFYDTRIVGDDILFPYYEKDSLSGFKVRSLLEKKFYVDGSLSSSSLFGQKNFSSGGKAVTITEGEFDALSAFQMMGSKYPVVSVKSGAGSAVKDCQANYEWLDSFDSIYICFDADEPGQKAASQVADLFGPKAKIMRHLPDVKDANEYLQQGKQKEFIERWWQSQSYEPDGILCTADLWDLVSTPLERAPVEYPYSEMNKLTYGIRPAELVTVTAGSGLGKSQFLRELVWHIMNKTEDNIGMLFLEEGKRKTTEALMSLAANKPLHLPQEFDTEEEREEATKQRKEAFDVVHGQRRLYLYDYFGSDKLEHIISKLRYLVKSKECKYIFLDHVTMLVSSQEYGDERKLIDEIMTKLRMFVQETGVALFVVSHLKRPDGRGHEEGAATSLAQLRGSGSIGQLSDIVIGLERNGQAEAELERNTTHIRILKNRFSGLTGPAGAAVYSRDTGRMLELVEEEVL
jgi:twinkle protein